MRHALRALPALALAAAGVLALLLARDVQHRQTSFHRDDARFRSSPANVSWTPSQLVPFGAASSLLGVDDDVAYRRAVRVLRLSKPHALVFGSPPALALRAEAQLELGALAASARPAARRSAVQNFLGGLVFAAAADDPDSEASLLESAAAAFRAAIVSDEANADAKYNLELALSRLRAAQSASIPRSRVGSASAGQGAGVGRAGSGY
jgi:hypothetical protein